MFGYYRRRYYRRNPFSCSFTSCFTSIIGLVGTLIVLLFLSGALTAAEVLNFIWIIGGVAIAVVVLYLVLRYGKFFKKTTTKKKTSTTTRSRSAPATTTRRSSTSRDEEDDRYARAPARATTTSKSTWSPREDVTDEPPARTTTTRKKKASFFDGVDSGEEASPATAPAQDVKPCAKCGNANPPHAKFCTGCGKAL